MDDNELDRLFGEVSESGSKPEKEPSKDKENEASGKEVSDSERAEEVLRKNGFIVSKYKESPEMTKKDQTKNRLMRKRRKSLKIQKILKRTKIPKSLKRKMRNPEKELRKTKSLMKILKKSPEKTMKKTLRAKRFLPGKNQRKRLKRSLHAA